MREKPGVEMQIYTLSKNPWRTVSPAGDFLHYASDPERFEQDVLGKVVARAHMFYGRKCW